METPQQPPEIIDYVCGFLFNQEHTLVALIRKEKGPAAVIGKLNGLGGKIEDKDINPDFNPYRLSIGDFMGLPPRVEQTAMAREFGEETYLRTDPGQWMIFARHSVTSPPSSEGYKLRQGPVTARICFLAAKCPPSYTHRVVSREQEHVAWYEVGDIPHLARRGELAPNVAWLIPAALHMSMTRPIHFG